MTANQLSKIGEALYGSRWQTELAHALGVAPRTMRRWLAGEDPIPPYLGERLNKLRSKRIAEIQRVTI